MKRQDELTLDQMLADPIVRLLMAGDGVTDAQVRSLMGSAAIMRRPDVLASDFPRPPRA